MKSNVIVNGLSIPTKVEEFEDSNILEVEAGTNELQKGGIANGARTYFRIKDLGRTKMQCDFEPMGKGNEVCEVTITVTRSCARSLMVSVLPLTLWRNR